MPESDNAIDDEPSLDASQESDRGILWKVLLINLGQCLAGIIGGNWASSTAVIGAGLDNLGDAAVYAVSLYAVGRSATIKKRAAQLSGCLLIGFAGLLLVEVVRRFFGGEAPVGPAMMAMAAANALLNIYCIRLLRQHRGQDINFKASAIFTNNAFIVNGAIVLSGALVMWMNSNLPDLILGTVVSGVAAKGGYEILSETKESQQ